MCRSPNGEFVDSMVSSESIYAEGVKRCLAKDVSEKLGFGCDEFAGWSADLRQECVDSLFKSVDGWLVGSTSRVVYRVEDDVQLVCREARRL